MFSLGETALVPLSISFAFVIIFTMCNKALFNKNESWYNNLCRYLPTYGHSCSELCILNRLARPKFYVKEIPAEIPILQLEARLTILNSYRRLYVAIN